MDRIVVLMQEKKSADLMRDRLTNNYQVLETEIDQSLDFSFDLGIVDESALKQTWEEVQSRKEAAERNKFPFQSRREKKQFPVRSSGKKDFSSRLEGKKIHAREGNEDNIFKATYISICLFLTTRL